MKLYVMQAKANPSQCKGFINDMWQGRGGAWEFSGIVKCFCQSLLYWLCFPPYSSPFLLRDYPFTHLFVGVLKLGAFRRAVAMVTTSSLSSRHLPFYDTYEVFYISLELYLQSFDYLVSNRHFLVILISTVQFCFNPTPHTDSISVPLLKSCNRQQDFKSRALQIGYNIKRALNHEQFKNRGRKRKIRFWHNRLAHDVVFSDEDCYVSTAYYGLLEAMRSTRYASHSEPSCSAVTNE